MCDLCCKEPETGKTQTFFPRLLAVASEMVESTTPDCTDEKECPRCERTMTGVNWRRLNTAYVDEESNWFYSCRDCYGDAVEHYEQMWKEYAHATT